MARILCEYCKYFSANKLVENGVIYHLVENGVIYHGTCKRINVPVNNTNFCSKGVDKYESK